LKENKTATPVYGPKSRPHHPIKFNGKTNPDAGDQWLKDMDRIFDAKMCLEDSRLAFSVYMLTREAEHWWISTKSIMEERQESVTWEVF